MHTEFIAGPKIPLKWTVNAQNPETLRQANKIETLRQANEIAKEFRDEYIRDRAREDYGN